MNRETAELFEMLYSGTTTESQIDKLISQGADIRDGLETGHTMLMAACMQEDSGHLIPYLINKGADVNATTEEGYTALMYACISNSDEIAKHIPNLVSAGANTDITAKDGSNAFSLAAESNCESARKALPIITKKMEKVHRVRLEPGLVEDKAALYKVVENHEQIIIDRSTLFNIATEENYLFFGLLLSESLLRFLSSSTGRMGLLQTVIKSVEEKKADGETPKITVAKKDPEILAATSSEGELVNLFNDERFTISKDKHSSSYKLGTAALFLNLHHADVTAETVDYLVFGRLQVSDLQREELQRNLSKTREELGDDDLYESMQYYKAVIENPLHHLQERIKFLRGEIASKYPELMSRITSKTPSTSATEAAASQSTSALIHLINL